MEASKSTDKLMLLQDLVDAMPDGKLAKLKRYELKWELCGGTVVPHLLMEFYE